MFRRRSRRVDVSDNLQTSEQRRMIKWLIKMVEKRDRELDELREAEQSTNNSNGSSVSPSSVVLPLRVQRYKQYLEVYIANMRQLLTTCMMSDAPPLQWFEELRSRFFQLSAEMEGRLSDELHFNGDVDG